MLKCEFKNLPSTSAILIPPINLYSGIRSPVAMSCKVKQNVSYVFWYVLSGTYWNNLGRLLFILLFTYSQPTSDKWHLGRGGGKVKTERWWKRRRIPSQWSRRLHRIERLRLRILFAASVEALLIFSLVRGILRIKTLAVPLPPCN